VLVQQNKSVFLPQKTFYAVASSSTEQEQSAAEQIETELPLYQRGKAVNRTAQISVTDDEIDPLI
jgi:hypothetical protein